jgi:hypothetical protein
MIARRRERAIALVFDVIKKAIERYQGDKIICQSPRNGYACDGMVLGCLIKSLTAAGIWPIPEPPYKDVTDLSFKLRDSGFRHSAIKTLTITITPRRAIHFTIHF